MEKPRHHACAKSVGPGNANRCLGVSAIFHSESLHNDGPCNASSPLLSLGNKAMLGCGNSRTFGNPLQFHGTKSSSHKFELHLGFQQCNVPMAVDPMKSVRSISS
jgi:hypothetical protein